jgi:pseudouridine-5'-phosphate glycosidase
MSESYIRDVNLELQYSSEVENAVKQGQPIVALESTIIAHGMPHPQNLESAKRVEDVIRNEGAIPATIAILEGRCCIGLDERQLEFLATGKDIMKLSRRDLAYAISQGRSGATTVAATMILAEKAGIRVFATGGIGGVHRGVSATWDISADLTELAQASVAVISAGAKAILDIPKTLEALETLGVPVIGFGVNEFPAFYTRSSDSKVDFRMDDTAEIANFLRAKWDFGLEGGVLIANPIAEEYDLGADVVNGAVVQAIEKADEQGVRGKELTPFLLSEIKSITKGSSLDSNIELVLSNAKLGAKIAVAMA